MGVYISLSVVINTITDEEWKNFYNMADIFLKKYPNKLGRLQKMIIHTKRKEYYRYSYVENLECKDHFDNQFLRTEGTIEDYSFGESFIIPSKLSANVLCTNTEEIKSTKEENCIKLFDNINTAFIFNNKTQGQTYHYAILAVGMLAEHMFQDRALVTGDISLGQAKQSSLLLKNALGIDVSTPRVTNAGELYAIFATKYDTVEACNQTILHYRGNETSATEALCAVVDRLTFEQWQKQAFLQEETMTIGFIQSCIDWLNATSDVTALVRMVTVDKDGPRMPLDDFIAVLADTGISLSSKYEKKISFIRNPAGEEIELDTVHTQLGYFVLLMNQFICIRAKHCLGKKKVLDAISMFCKGNKEKYEYLLDYNTERVKETINKWYGIYKNTENKIRNDIGVLGADSFKFNRTENITKKQVKFLRESLGDIKILIDNCKSEIQVAFKSGLFDSEKEAVREFFLEMCEKNRIALPEYVWAVIDKESDLWILYFYAVLAASSNQDQNFLELRIHIFMHNAIARYLSSIHEAKQASKS